MLFDLLLHSLVSAVVFPCSRCSKYNMAHLNENDCLHLCFFFILYVYRYVYNSHNCTYTFSSLLWRLFRLDFLWQSDSVSTLKEKKGHTTRVAQRQKEEGCVARWARFLYASLTNPRRAENWNGCWQGATEEVMALYYINN